MECKKCGGKLTAEMNKCPACGAEVKKARKKPFLPVRLVLQLVSLALCLVLTVCLLATALLADVHLLTSTGGIQTLLSHLVAAEEPAPEPTDPAVGAAGVIVLRDSIQIPDETPAGSGALTEYVYTLVGEVLGEDVTVSMEQVKAFIEESTIMDFVAEKTVSLMQDVLNGTQSTTITTDEIIQLVDDNQEIIEETFHVEITEEMKQDMAVQIEEAVVDTDISAALHDSVNRVMQMEVPGTNGLTVSDLLAQVQALNLRRVLLVAIGLCLALMAALCILNSYNLAGGLHWSASACTFSGVLLSLPLALIQAAPSLLADYMPETADTMQIFSSAAAVLAPIHYGLLAFGVALLIGSSVLRAMTKGKR